MCLEAILVKLIGSPSWSSIGLFFWSVADAIFPVRRVFVHLYLGEVTE